MTETNNTPTPPPTEWEDFHGLEFYGLTKNLTREERDGLWKFIEQALAEQKARMVEVVEGMKHKDELGFKDRPFYGTVTAQNAVLNYNKAISDIIKALSK